MSESGLQVIWICGAIGAGKSAAAWGLYEELAAAGSRVAYVDIDQLGMLYPAPDDDTRWRHTFKCDALAMFVPGYVASGAQLLIVSGVVDPHNGPGAPLPLDTDMTLCLLSPDHAVLRGGFSRVGEAMPTLMRQWQRMACCRRRRSWTLGSRQRNCR